VSNVELKFSNKAYTEQKQKLNTERNVIRNAKRLLEDEKFLTKLSCEYPLTEFNYSLISDNTQYLRPKMGLDAYNKMERVKHNLYKNLEKFYLFYEISDDNEINATIVFLHNGVSNVINDDEFRIFVTKEMNEKGRTFVSISSNEHSQFLMIYSKTPSEKKTWKFYTFDSNHPKFFLMLNDLTEDEFNDFLEELFGFKIKSIPLKHSCQNEVVGLNFEDGDKKSLSCAYTKDIANGICALATLFYTYLFFNVKDVETLINFMEPDNPNDFKTIKLKKVMNYLMTLFYGELIRLFLKNNIPVERAKTPIQYDYKIVLNAGEQLLLDLLIKCISCV
tara:strand:+ start:134 stop:1135 length:1002 start_codon:yes stop_codon:yes gene_type:complete